ARTGCGRRRDSPENIVGERGPRRCRRVEGRVGCKDNAPEGVVLDVLVDPGASEAGGVGLELATEDVVEGIDIRGALRIGVGRVTGGCSRVGDGRLRAIGTYFLALAPEAVVVPLGE